MYSSTVPEVIFEHATPNSSFSDALCFNDNDSGLVITSTIFLSDLVQVSHREIKQSTIASLSRDSIFSFGRALDEAMEEQDEDKPSADTRAFAQGRILTAMRLIRRSHLLPTPKVVGLEGALRVTWTKKTKNVRVVFFPEKSNRESYVYQERVFNNRSYASHLFEPADSTLIADH